MTKEEIIRMAREAVSIHPEYTTECTDPDGMDLEVLVRFAELVIAAEREACAVICDQISADELCNCNEDESRIAIECANAIRSRK